MSARQTAKISDFLGRPRLEFNDPEHGVHWKVCDSGYAYGNFFMNGDGSLSLDLTEVSENARSSKRVMLTLDPKVTAALHDYIGFGRAKADLKGIAS